MEVILVCYIMVTTADGHELTSQMSYLYITVIFRQQTHSSLTWFKGSSDGKHSTTATGIYISYTALQKKPIIGTPLVLIAANVRSFLKQNAHRRIKRSTILSNASLRNNVLNASIWQFYI
jgi:hypothetical protein